VNVLAKLRANGPFDGKNGSGRLGHPLGSPAAAAVVVVERDAADRPRGRRGVAKPLPATATAAATARGDEEDESVAHELLVRPPLAAVGGWARRGRSGRARLRTAGQGRGGGVAVDEANDADWAEPSRACRWYVRRSCLDGAVGDDGDGEGDEEEKKGREKGASAAETR